MSAELLKARERAAGALMTEARCSGILLVCIKRVHISVMYHMIRLKAGRGC